MKPNCDKKTAYPLTFAFMAGIIEINLSVRLF